MSATSFIALLVISAISAVANAWWYRRRRERKFAFRALGAVWFALAITFYFIRPDAILFTVMAVPSIAVILGSMLYEETDRIVARTRRFGAKGILISLLPACALTVAAFLAANAFDREALAVTLAVFAGLGWTAVLWWAVSRALQRQGR